MADDTPPNRPVPKWTRRPKYSEADVVDPDSPITGVHPATRDFVRAAASEISKNGLFRVAVGVGTFALVCFVSGVTVSSAMAQKAKDAGVEAAAAVKQQADETAEDLKAFKLEVRGALQQGRDSDIRQESKLNAVLDKFRIPDPAPTPSPVVVKDGGR